MAAGQSDIPDTVQSAPGISIESSVDRAEIYIGDLIKYTLSVTYDSAINLTPPPIGANLGAFDVKDYEMDDEVKLDDGRIQLKSSFVLTTFTTGDYIIPPIPIEFYTADSVRKILISEPMPIKVKSLLAESADTADIRDIKGPIEFKSPIPTYVYLIGIAILLLIAGLIYWWWRRHRPEEAKEFIDPREPWEIAFEAMAFLKERSYPAKGEFKLYYVELTEIIRSYLERIYKIPVMDMTTWEFLSTIKDAGVDEDLFGRFKKFLEYADLVKFAKMIPGPEQMENDYSEGYNLIDVVRQVELNKKPVMPEPIKEESSNKEGEHV